MSTPLLQVEDLVVEVDLAPRTAALSDWNDAVRGVSLAVERGQAHGLVGESGCGKSLTVLSILDLLPERSVRRRAGEVTFDGEPIATSAAFASLRGRRIGYVPQNPMGGLNPVFTIGDQVAEAVRLHHDLGRGGARQRAVELLERVGLPSPAERSGAYPHELSGGQRQRVLIAIALAGDPELIIADEPTTALDVTVQAQVLRLLGRLRRDRALGLLLVTHDLGVVAQTCDVVSILYAGQVVEHGPAAEVLRSPRHPYTRGLLSSIPGRRSREQPRLTAIPGVVPALGQWPTGCTFRDRCPRAESICAREEPALRQVEPGRWSACHFAEAVS